MSGSEETAGTQVLAIDGMTCGGCVATVKRVLSRVPGVTGSEVDLETGRARVDGQATRADLVSAIEGAGFDVRPA